MILPNRYAHEIRNNDLLNFRDGLEKVSVFIDGNKYKQLVDTWLGLPHHGSRPGSHVHRNIP